MAKGPTQAAASAAPPPPATANVTVKTADVSVRLGFLRKVYTLLTFNLLITIGISCILTFVLPVREFIRDHQWIVWAAIGVAFAALITLACVRVKYPVNLILMYIFVISFSVMIGAIVARYYESGYGIIVLQAFFVTAAVFFTITAYVAITKKDFSFLYGFLGAALVVLIGLILMNFVLTWKNGKLSRGFTFAISLLGYVSSSPFFCFYPHSRPGHQSPNEPASISANTSVFFLHTLPAHCFVSICIYSVR